jgi:hypothetical protein
MELVTAKVEKSLLQGCTADLVSGRQPEPQPQPQLLHSCCTSAPALPACQCPCFNPAIFRSQTLANCLCPAFWLSFIHCQVTFLHGLHLVDTPRALDEAHRLLRPHGKLAAAWNDR